MATSKEKKDLWARWAGAAITAYKPPDEKLDNDELADDMVDVATKVADSMLDAYEEQFEGVKRSKADKKRRRRVEEEEEEQEEDEDEDEDEDE